MKYDIILQNNASREFTILRDLENSSSTELYLQFEEVELDVPDGEYTYTVVCFTDEDTEVSYSPKTPILDTIVQTVEGDIILKNLRPLTGLLRVGKIGQTNAYDDSNNKTFYYEG